MRFYLRFPNMEDPRINERHKTHHEFYFATFSLGIRAQQCREALNHNS